MAAVNFNWILAIVILGDEGSLQQLADFLRNQSDRIASTHTELNRHETHSTIPNVTQNPATAEVNHLITTMPANETCEIPRFTFKDANHLDYIRYNGIVPNMTSFTVCFWIRCEASSPGNQAIVSYCVPGDDHCNTLVIWLKKGKFKVFFKSLKHGVVSGVGNGNYYHYRTHVCIVKSGTSLRLHINASEHDFDNKAHEKLRGGGVLILGQNLDVGHNGSRPEPRNDYQGFRGDIGGFQLWNDSLSCDEIGDLYQSGECACPGGDGLILSMNKSNSVVKGSAVAEWSATC